MTRLIKAKRNVIAATALLGFISLSGCGPTSLSSNDSSFSSASSSSSAAEAYIPYDAAAYGDPSSLSADITLWTTTGKQNQDALDAINSAFNAEYPNIHVSILPQGGYSDIQTKINQAIPSGTTPTMAYCYPDHVANYLDAGSVLNMQDFVDDPTIGFLEANKDVEGFHEASGGIVYGEDDFIPGYWNEGKAYPTEGLYSVPFTKSTEAIYYNKTLFDRNGWSVPETWEEMWSLCDTIKAAMPEKIPLGYDSDSNLFISALAANDIPYTSATGAHYLFNNAAAKALVQTWVDKYNAGEFVTKGILPNNEYTSTKFLEQGILMIVSSTAGTSYANTDNFDVGVAALPHYTGHELKIISQGPSICFFRRASWAQRYAAWLFYKFCTRADMSARFAVASTGYDPVRTSSYDTDFYKDWLADNSNTLYGLTAALTATLRDDYFFSPVFDGSSNARDAVGAILSYVINEGLTIDAAFQKAYDACITG